LIGGQPNIEEWIDKDTWKQAIDSGLVVGEEKVKGAVRSIGDLVDATIEKLTSWKN
jgi:glycerol-3-phosphate responsive antiterminator